MVKLRKEPSIITIIICVLGLIFAFWYSFKGINNTPYILNKSLNVCGGMLANQTLCTNTLLSEINQKLEELILKLK